jgi:hypothetical protein
MPKRSSLDSAFAAKPLGDLALGNNKDVARENFRIRRAGLRRFSCT